MRVPRKCSKWSTTTTKIPYARSRNHCVHRRVYQQQMAWSATTSGNKQNDDVNNCNMFFVQWSDKRRPTQNCNCKYSIMPDQLATKKNCISFTSTRIISLSSFQVDFSGQKTGKSLVYQPRFLYVPSNRFHHIFLTYDVTNKGFSFIVIQRSFYE